MFGIGRWSGKPEKIAAGLAKLLAKEAAVESDTVVISWQQKREVLSWEETFIAPLNNMPSHIYRFELNPQERHLIVQVFIDGDRGSPLGVLLQAPTRFDVMQVVEYRPKLFGGQFISGAQHDIERLERGGLASLLKRCTNQTYANIMNPDTSVQLIPIEKGSQCVAYRMPKDRWGLPMFDELGAAHFCRLLSSLDSLA